MSIIANSNCITFGLFFNFVLTWKRHSRGSLTLCFAELTFSIPNYSLKTSKKNRQSACHTRTNNHFTFTINASWDNVAVTSSQAPCDVDHAHKKKTADSSFGATCAELRMLIAGIVRKENGRAHGRGRRTASQKSSQGKEGPRICRRQREREARIRLNR